ncbi:hypothetical protein B0T10DRAFT_466670 [Thelonectria olida]|uniref:Uncharacterized protein n=1 Tax=Thelonectria olida TaxID=1576542 RepID=A0A9P9AIT1_9HYPO|nr:hypothetical protein B0T10DRAFT_466670 [Thelonectria olida]
MPTLKLSVQPTNKMILDCLGGHAIQLTRSSPLDAEELAIYWCHYGTCREKTSGGETKLRYEYPKQGGSQRQNPLAISSGSKVNRVHRNFAHKPAGTSSLPWLSTSPNSDLLMAMVRDCGLEHIYRFHVEGNNLKTSPIPAAKHTEQWQLPSRSAQASWHPPSPNPAGNLPEEMEHLDFTAAMACPEIRTFDEFVCLLQNFHKDISVSLTHPDILEGE